MRTVATATTSSKPRRMQVASRFHLTNLIACLGCEGSLPKFNPLTKNTLDPRCNIIHTLIIRSTQIYWHATHSIRGERSMSKRKGGLRTLPIVRPSVKSLREKERAMNRAQSSKTHVATAGSWPNFHEKVVALVRLGRCPTLSR